MDANQIGVLCSDSLIPVFPKYIASLGFDIRALWTPLNDSTVQTCAQLDIPFAADKPDEVLLRKDVQAIIVAGCARLHAQLCIKCLGIGKHVLCAWPCALTRSDSQKLLQASLYYPQLLALAGFGLRLSPVFVKLRQLLQECALGAPLIVDAQVKCRLISASESELWTLKAEEGGGALNLVGAHLIELVSWLLGKKVQHVHASTRNFSHVIQSKDIQCQSGDHWCQCVLEMEGALVASINVNALWTGEFSQQISVTCSEGCLTACNEQLFICKNEHSSETGESSTLSLVGDAELESVPVFLHRPQPYWQHLLDLLAILRQRLKTQTSITDLATFQDAHYVHAVVQAAEQSARTGQWTSVQCELCLNEAAV